MSLALSSFALDQGLFTFQIEGPPHLSARRVAFLCDPMGLGKSIQAIRACDRVLVRRVLVICQAIARIHWSREFEKFGLLARTCFIVQGKKVIIPADADVVIVNYDVAHNHLAQLRKRAFDVAIIDEAQALKNRKARRTKAVYGRNIDRRGGLVEFCRQVWLLTGTPRPNGNDELWTHFRALTPNWLKSNGVPLSFTGFQAMFCELLEGDWGVKVVGNRNNALMKRLLAPLMLRRPSDVAGLPEFRRVPLVLDPGPLAAELRKLEQSPELAPLLQVLQAAAAVEESEGETPYANPDLDDAALAALARVDSEQWSRLRRLTGIAKADPVAHLVSHELDSGDLDKVVLFCRHTAVLRRLEARLDRYGVVLVDGSVSATARQRSIDQFQKDPDCRVFLGQLQAAGTSITLTASRHILIVEPSTTPAENAQAEKRCHRIGQRWPVLARYVTLAGSLDETITRIMQRRVRMLTEVMPDSLPGGKP